MALKESGEMYLETIYTLCKSRGCVRSVDIAEEMHYSRASVSRAMGLLREQDLITVDEEGHITLTETGKVLADKINERHTVLTRMFVALGVDPETAADDACRIEHVISDRCFEAVKAHLEMHLE